MEFYPEAKMAGELLSLCRYSEGHFSELFMDEFGESSYKWMQKQKAKHIIVCVAQSEVSLKAIINEFKLTSQSLFNRYYKAQFSTSIAQLRRELEAASQQFNDKLAKS